MKGRRGLHLEALLAISLCRNRIIGNSVFFPFQQKESKGDVANFSKATSQFRIRFNRAVLGGMIIVGCEGQKMGAIKS